MSKLRTKQILDFVTDVQAGMENYLTTAASNADAVVLSSAKSYADQAEADGLADAKAYTDARELVIEGEYATADSVVLSSAVVLDAAILSDAKVYADGLVGGVDYRELEAINVTATTFETTELFDMSVDAEVDVFINGLQIHRYDAEVKEGEKEGEKHGWRFAGAGNKFEIVALGYTLDNVDHVIVSGKLS